MLVLQRFLPKFFRSGEKVKGRAKTKNTHKSGADDKNSCCRVQLLDDSELPVDIKVGLVLLNILKWVFFMVKLSRMRNANLCCCCQQSERLQSVD